jgi:hypothetical protein
MNNRTPTVDRFLGFLLLISVSAMFLLVVRNAIVISHNNVKLEKLIMEKTHKRDGDINDIKEQLNRIEIAVTRPSK